MAHRFNPHMLVMGRHIRGLTQVDLAGLAGIEQGTISRLESGDMPAKVETVDKLAQALSFPTAFFYRAYTPQPKELWNIRCKHGGR